MSYVDIPALIECGIHPTQARIFADPLDAACARWEITTPERIAAFISQLAHESANFAVLEENLWYKTPERIRSVFPSTVKSLEEARQLVRNPQALANRVYANRLGNGPERSGDGWKYRGRGLIQTTGLQNYQIAQRLTGDPLVARPELILVPATSAMVAGAYWFDNNCNRAADRGDLDAITRAINGPGMRGREERNALYAEALPVFAA